VPRTTYQQESPWRQPERVGRCHGIRTQIGCERSATPSHPPRRSPHPTHHLALLQADVDGRR
jgi:hypothetical protein